MNTLTYINRGRVGNEFELLFSSWNCCYWFHFPSLDTMSANIWTSINALLSNSILQRFTNHYFRQFHQVSSCMGQPLYRIIFEFYSHFFFFSFLSLHFNSVTFLVECRRMSNSQLKQISHMGHMNTLCSYFHFPRQTTPHRTTQILFFKFVKQDLKNQKSDSVHETLAKAEFGEGNIYLVFYPHFC